MLSMRLVCRRVSSFVRRQSSTSSTFDRDSFSSLDDVDPQRQRTRSERCINKVTLLGRVGKEGTMRGSDEHPCLIFPMATNFSHRKETGEMITKTDWHRICVFNPGIRNYARNFRKGDRIYLQGVLSYHKVMDDEDKANFITSIIANEIILISRPRGNDGALTDGE